MPQPRIPIASIRHRETDPAVERLARRRGDLIAAKLQARADDLVALLRRADDAPQMADKIAHLYALGDYIGKLAAPHVGCQKGCDSCCHIAVQIPQAEADDLGRRLGRPVAPVAYVQDDGAHLANTPCPFVKKGACSIYADRPFVCRLYFSLDSKDWLCRVDHGERTRTLLFPHGTWRAHFLDIIGRDQAHKMADLRDYFPKDRA